VRALIGAAAVWIVAGSLLAYLGQPSLLPSFRRWSTAEPGAPTGELVDTGL
jgi:hypothetical protein